MAGNRSRIDRARQVWLTLLPSGAVEREELDRLASALSERGMRITVAQEQSIPPVAFKAERQQYRADVILKLARNEPGDRVLAITECDLYADNLKFVFGMADAPGRCAVISLYRLRAGADEETFRRRAVKEAVHELGHTFGLSHCANPRCVMHFSNSLGDTDRNGSEWCELCEQKFQASRGNIQLLQQDGG
ncbi:MAG: archaemetzincin family Zn-dependent metalloprotease [Deltaproteobacteria bacterium]|nr:archaemetzincin family Zn-dependent metalloprotease [Deltaproteobacteria bacterium]